MKILHLIHVMLAQAYYRRALAEISPMHPDVPHIVHRQRELEDKARDLFA